MESKKAPVALETLLKYLMSLFDSYSSEFFICTEVQTNLAF